MKYVIEIELNQEEKGIVINSLTDFRNKMLSEDIDTEVVDRLLLKILDAPEKKRMFPRKYADAR
jgi:hypothetical protein